VTDGSLPLLVPVLAAALVATASPGPATLAIAREAMAHGRGAGLSLALGVTLGSWTWSALAAGGMGTLLLAHGWMLEAMRVLAALYLGWLAWRSARAALAPGGMPAPAATASGRSFVRGLMIHLTNPKALLFFGALYSVGLPPDTSPADVAVVAAAVGMQSLAIFVAMALAFSHGGVVAGYLRLRRAFEAAFAAIFAAAALTFAAPLLRLLAESLRRTPA
jgi:threonine/homoserine/homoserine lactone efflux protein